MTEIEWLTVTDHTAHTRFIADRLSPRRQRLLAAAFCRAVECYITHPDLLAALFVVERFADGHADATDLGRARQRCREITQEEYEAYRRQIDGGAVADSGGLVAGFRGAGSEFAWAVAYAATTPLPLTDVGTLAASAAVQARTGVTLLWVTSAEFDAATYEYARLMRSVVWEVVGNPFEPADFTSWRTSTAVLLAQQMYESGDFSAMPILADALQDAGCDNDDVLTHCREPRKHIRGCWVIDGVLARE
jgi:hypothetical protein